MVADANEPNTGSPPPGPASKNVDKIRNILFGQQMRETEQRFAYLEQRIEGMAAGLHQAVDRRGKEVETTLRAEINRSTQQLRDKLERMDRETAQGLQGLQRQLTEQSDAFEAAYRQLRADLTRALEQETSVLRADKLDKSALAALLSDLAQRLDADQADADAAPPQ